jgi:pimeloyl-ACP methyl ester carboxylesterase
MVIQPHFQFIDVEGGQLRVAVAGRGPLVVMVHGWPESWYSYRHQMAHLASRGYKVAALDMRGYGGSLKPEKTEAYDMIHMTDDIVATIDGLGYPNAILMGHDWGAPISWTAAILHPIKVRAVIGLSVPHIPRSPQKPTERMRQVYKDRFFYQLYFQQPRVAEAELEADTMDTLRKILYTLSGDASDAEMHAAFNKPTTATFLQGMSCPETFPPWLSQEDLLYYFNEFSQSGFRGALNRYRNIDRDHEILPQLENSRITQPSMFVAGARDVVLKFFPTQEICSFIQPFYQDLRICKLIPGKGHWIQQEAPREVNELITKFLDKIMIEAAF